MTRSHSFRMALPLGMLIAGPAITVVSFVVRWPFGLTSSLAFTHYFGLILAIGAATGLLGGIACGVTRCRPWASGAMAGGGVFAALGAVTAVMAVRGSLDTINFGLLAEVLICSLSAAATAYLTAVLALAWERRRPARESPGLQPQPPDSRYRL